MKFLMKFQSTTPRSRVPGRNGRRCAQGTAIGGIVVSALFMLALPASATTSQHALSTQPQNHSRIIFPPPPDCGGIISLTNVQFSGDDYSFKIVGVDLYVWLGER